MKSITKRIATTLATLLMLDAGVPVFAAPSELPSGKTSVSDNGAPKGQMIFKVVDGTGSGISGATVVMRHNGHSITFKSKAEGNARDLEPGVYSIAARKAGVGRNRVSTAVTTEAPTTFTMTLTPHVGYSGGYHRVWRRRRVAVEEVNAPRERGRIAADRARKPAVAEKGDEPLDTTPNGALKRLPGTQRARNRAGAGGGGGIATGGGGPGAGGGQGDGPKASRPVGKATVKK